MIHLVHLLLEVGLAALFIWLRRHPGTSWSRLLLTPRGPRTDVARMSKEDLYASGRTFLQAGVLCALLWVAFNYVAYNLGGYDWERPFVIGPVLFISALFGLFTGMGVLGGTYLLLRGALRPRIPPGPGSVASGGTTSAPFEPPREKPRSRSTASPGGEHGS